MKRKKRKRKERNEEKKTHKGKAKGLPNREGSLGEDKVKQN